MRRLALPALFIVGMAWLLGEALWFLFRQGAGFP